MLKFISVALGVLLFSHAIAQKIKLEVGEPCQAQSKSGTCRTRAECIELTGWELNLITYCNRNEGIVCCPEEVKQWYKSVVKLTSERACEEYSKIAPGTCKQDFISNGKLAVAKQFPPAALLGKHNPTTNTTEWNCGGTLISERFVLSAAHCTLHGHPNIVRLGDLDYSTNTDNVGIQEFFIRNVIIHPQFDVDRYNDIMLLELNGTVKFTEYVLPACLLTPNMWQYDQGIYTAIGWGSVDDSNTMSKRLLWTQLSRYSRDCSTLAPEVYELQKGVLSSQFCVHRLTNDICHAYSGSPLLVDFSSDFHVVNKCLYIVAGIVSQGQTLCGSQDIPSLNTNVTAFIRFIESHVWP